MSVHKWFWRGVIALVAVVLLLGVFRVSWERFEGAIEATIIPLGSGLLYFPDVGTGDTMDTVNMKTYVDHDDAAAFQNSRQMSTPVFAARTGESSPLFNNGVVHHVKSAAVTRSENEVLRYVINSTLTEVIGTFYLGAVHTAQSQDLNVPDTFEAFSVLSSAEGGTTFIHDISANDDGEVYLVLLDSTTGIATLEKFVVDYSSGELLQTGISSPLPNPNPNSSLGRTLYHGDQLYFADFEFFYTVEENLGSSGFDFTNVSGTSNFASATGVANIQAVAASAGPLANFDFFLISTLDALGPSVRAHLVVRSGPDFIISPPFEPSASSTDWNHVSLSLLPDLSTPVLFYRGGPQDICTAELYPAFSSRACMTFKTPVTWIDSAVNAQQDVGAVLFQTPTEVVRAIQTPTSPFLQAVSTWTVGQFQTFERWFGVNQLSEPVWYQVDLLNTGSLTTSQPIFRGNHPFGSVVVSGSVIGPDPLSFDLHWSQESATLPPVSVSRTIQMTGTNRFSVTLPGTHMDSHSIGDMFQFEFSDEVLVSDLQIVPETNQKMSFQFPTCVVQQNTQGLTTFRISTSDPEGDVPISGTVNGVTAVCGGNTCVADVTLLPGPLNASVVAEFLDNRGNTSSATAVIDVRAAGGTCTTSGRTRPPRPSPAPVAPPPAPVSYTPQISQPVMIDPFLGIAEIDHRMTASQPLDDLLSRFSSSEYPLQLELCTLVSFSSFQEQEDCDSLTVSSASQNVSFSAFEAFTQQYVLPLQRSVSFQTRFRVIPQGRAFSHEFKSNTEQLSWNPTFRVQDDAERELLPGTRYYDVPEVVVLSRWPDIVATWRGRPRTITPLHTPTEAVFESYDPHQSPDLHRILVTTPREGHLEVQLFQEGARYDLTGHVVVDVPVLPAAPEPIEEEPVDFDYPPFKLYFTELSNAVTFFVVIDAYSGLERNPVDPQDLSIRLRTEVPGGVVPQLQGRTDGYPYLQATLESGTTGVALDFRHRLDGQEVIYHTEFVDTGTVDGIRHGLRLSAPLPSDTVQNVQNNESPSDLISISEQVSAFFPTHRFTNESLTTSGISNGRSFVKSCIVELSTSSVLEGKVIPLESNGTFYGRLTDQQLENGEYLSVLFADADQSCEELLASWFALEIRDPIPVPFEISEGLQIDVFSMEWIGSDVTAVNSEKLIASDLSGRSDFLSFLRIESPYAEEVEVVVQLVNDLASFSERVPGRGTIDIPLSADSFPYGKHSLLVYGILPDGQKTPDILFPFEFVPEEPLQQEPIAVPSFVSKTTLLSGLGLLIFVLGFAIWFRYAIFPERIEAPVDSEEINRRTGRQAPPNRKA